MTRQPGRRLAVDKKQMPAKPAGGEQQSGGSRNRTCNGSSSVNDMAKGPTPPLAPAPGPCRETCVKSEAGAADIVGSLS